MALLGKYNQGLSRRGAELLGQACPRTLAAGLPQCRRSRASEICLSAWSPGRRSGLARCATASRGGCAGSLRPAALGKSAGAWPAVVGRDCRSTGQVSKRAAFLTHQAPRARDNAESWGRGCRWKPQILVCTFSGQSG